MRDRSILRPAPGDDIERRRPEEDSREKLQELIGKLLGDVGGAMSGALVLVGDKLGFYRTLAEAVPLAPTSLAARTGTAPRYVREWSAAQAAGSAPRATSPVISIPIQKMFTHTAADRAGFRCRDIESMFVVSGAARATQGLSDVGAWRVRIAGCTVTIWSSYFEGVGNFVFMSHTKKPERAGRVRWSNSDT